MSRFDACLERGRLGESAISRWLQSRGCMVMPAYDVEIGSGKGPMMFCTGGNLVLPDLLTFSGERIIWVEAKHKTCFSWHRLTSRWVTGIDQRHYEDYRAIADRTRLPVWLLFLHPRGVPDDRDREQGCPDVCPTGLFGGSLAMLPTRENHRSTKHGNGGMVYWAACNLIRITDAEALSNG